MSHSCTSFGPETLQVHGAFLLPPKRPSWVKALKEEALLLRGPTSVPYFLHGGKP